MSWPPLAQSSFPVARRTSLRASASLRGAEDLAEFWLGVVECALGQVALSTETQLLNARSDVSALYSSCHAQQAPRARPRPDMQSLVPRFTRIEEAQAHRWHPLGVEAEAKQGEDGEE